MRQQSSRSNPPPPPPRRQSSSGKAKAKTGGDGDDDKGRSKSSNNEVTSSKTQSKRSTNSNLRPLESSGSSLSRSRTRSESKKQNRVTDSEISRSRSKSKSKTKTKTTTTTTKNSSSKQQPKPNSKSNTTVSSPSKTKRSSSTTIKKQQPSAKNKKRDKKLFADNARKAIPASIRMISGSHDTQTSADVSNISSQFQLPNPAGRSGGACTAALLNVLYHHNQKYGNNSNGNNMILSWVDVLRRMREVLQEKGFTQIPQLTSSRLIDVQHDHFVITPEDGSFQPTKNIQRAVLIGINYTGQSGQLTGCHNDVLNVAKYLMDVQGFKKENVTILMDDGVHKSPTKSAILSAYKRLVKESKSGDVVFCHYSGHGGRIVDDNGDEEDGYDETLIPVDFKQSGQIRDDDLLRILIHPMPAGVTMTCLMDCCHSGTVLDLPYRFVADGDSEEMVINDRVNFSDAVWSGMGLVLGMAAGSAVATAVASGVADAAAKAELPQEMMILGGGPNAIHEYSDSDCCVIL